METPQTPKKALFPHELADLEVGEDSSAAEADNGASYDSEGDISRRHHGWWQSGWTVVLGGFLLQLSVGSLHCGNISFYLSSFIRAKMEWQYDFEEATWVHSETVMAYGITMMVGGYLVRRMKPRNVAAIGCSIATTGVLLTRLTVNASPPLVVMTYGTIYGIGTGIAYVAPLVCGLRWYPQNPGLVLGLILSGFGLGSSFFSHVQAAVVNPNSKQLPVSSDVGYVEDGDKLARIPVLFLILGGLYVVFQTFGCAMLSDPPSPDFKNQEKDKTFKIDASKAKPNTLQKLTRAFGKFVKKLLMRQKGARPETMQAIDQQQKPIFVIGGHLPSADSATGCGDFNQQRPSSNSKAHPSASKVLLVDATITKWNLGSSSAYPILWNPSCNKVSTIWPLPSTYQHSCPASSEQLDDDLDLSPREAIQTRELSMLWVTCLFSQQVVGLCSHIMEKLVNQGLGLSRVSLPNAPFGPATCILHAIGTALWGYLADRFSYKTAMMAATGILTTALFIACWAIDQLASSHILYTTWSIVMFLCTRSSVSLVPSVVYKTFGAKYFGMNYSLVQTSAVISQAMHSLLLERIHQRYGIFGVMCATAICFGIVFVITWCYDGDSSPLKIRQRLAPSYPFNSHTKESFQVV